LLNGIFTKGKSSKNDFEAWTLIKCLNDFKPVFQRVILKYPVNFTLFIGVFSPFTGFFTKFLQLNFNKVSNFMRTPDADYDGFTGVFKAFDANLTLLQ